MLSKQHRITIDFDVWLERHTVQNAVSAFRWITPHLEDPRVCSSPDDYIDFQAALFHAIANSPRHLEMLLDSEAAAEVRMPTGACEPAFRDEQAIEPVIARLSRVDQWLLHDVISDDKLYLAVLPALSTDITITGCSVTRTARPRGRLRRNYKGIIDFQLDILDVDRDWAAESWERCVRVPTAISFSAYTDVLERFQQTLVHGAGLEQSVWGITWENVLDALDDFGGMPPTDSDVLREVLPLLPPRPQRFFAHALERQAGYEASAPVVEGLQGQALHVQMDGVDVDFRPEE